MSNQKRDSIIESTSYLLKKLGIPYTNSYLTKTLQTHPFYPSLAAMNDILAHYHVESEALKVSYEMLLQLQTPFIAHIIIKNGTFVVVEKVTDKGVLFYLEEEPLKFLTKEDFIKVWDRIICTVNPSSLSREPDYGKHRLFTLSAFCFHHQCGESAFNLIGMACCLFGSHDSIFNLLSNFYN